jgi:cytochrome d ubiquinol oxidase subunit I
VRPVIHWLAGIGIAVGALLSGYFIVATDAWMQHPVGFVRDAHGAIHLESFWAVLGNPYVGWQYAHTINGALLTAAFVLAGIGAFYQLTNRHPAFARLSLQTGLIAAAVLTVTQAVPTGDLAGKNVARFQPAKLAAMEGLFETARGAPLAIIGMPDTRTGQLLDPIYVPEVLSYLAYGERHATVTGVADIPAGQRPPIELTYYGYHIMVGLGTIFFAIAWLGLFLLARKRLTTSRWFLWILMLTIPFPYIANEMGWMVTEVGRQPWVIYGLMRTAEGTSTNVSAGETVFTTLGFAGVYCVLGLLFLLLCGRIIWKGPDSGDENGRREPHLYGVPA